MNRVSKMLVLAVAGLVLASSAAAQAAPRAERARFSRLGQRPVHIRDGIPRRGAGAVARTAAFDGYYTASNGDQVRVALSDSYSPDASVSQSWAEFFSQLPHGPELSRLTVYIVPLSEMTDLCGSPEADSCYIPSESMIVLVGNVPPDGSALEEIAAHEYGHQIANYSDNAPWDALTYGPKNWASYEGVCPQTRAGSLAPGDEGDAYPLNPGEGFAEAYRVYVGGSTADFRVAPQFIPDARDFRYIRQDIVHPWTGPQRLRSRGSLGGRSKARLVSLGTFRDGVLTARLSGSPGLDADLYLFDQKGRLLARSRGRTSREKIRWVVCGQTSMAIAVDPYAGSGRWTLTIDRP